MSKNPTSETTTYNPSLTPLDILIGEWKTVGKHPLMLGEELNGNASFKWIEGGAFIMMHAAIEHKDFPAGVAIFASDDASEEFTMNYYDERKVSRKYTCTIENNVWKWWRNDAHFSQRFTCTISEDGNKIISKGEMSKNGGAWEKDLELTYTRIQ